MQRTFLILVAGLLAFGNALAAAADLPTAEELYSRFKDTRIALSASGPAATLDFYSRQWLVNSLVNAIKDVDRPKGPVDYVKNTLWKSFAVGQSIDSVYSYELVRGMNGFPGLELRVTSRHCGKPGTALPSLVVMSFGKEDGAWRLVHATYSSLRTDTAWYSQSLIPIDTFPYIEPMDQTASLGELSKQLGAPGSLKDPCHEQQ
jgi:hypothetical protein